MARRSRLRVLVGLVIVLIVGIGIVIRDSWRIGVEAAPRIRSLQFGLFGDVIGGSAWKSGNTCYVCGMERRDANADKNIFVAGIRQPGDILWHRTLGGPEEDL